MGAFRVGPTGLSSDTLRPRRRWVGRLRLIQEGDSITIDAAQNLIQINVDEGELEERREKWQAPPIKYKSGVLAKYAKLVGSASEGAVTD